MRGLPPVAPTRTGPPEQRRHDVDHGDAPACAHFSRVYQGLARMSVVPFNRWNLLWVALYAALLLPLALMAMSVDELVKKLVGILV